MTDNPTIWKLEPGVRFRRLFDEAVLIHQRTAEALVLKDTAQLAADLAPFIEQLAAEGIIEKVENP